MPTLPGTPRRPAAFAQRIARWQASHGRHDLPWQGTRDAYRIWISEVMLQQTQVATVIPYFERFMARFPDVAALAAAPEDEVLALWSGLGYYARARNLQRAAREVVADHRGRFPSTFEALCELPGIGRSTAGAIAAFASGERRAILDGNVRRVLARHAGVSGDPSSAATLTQLWSVAESRLPARAIEGYTQGLMDLGATVCTAREPSCARCPVANDCVARIDDRVAELPGKRRRAPRPTRQVAMLVVVKAGEVLLEKRPPKGIWGGLWSLPECLPDEVPKGAQRLEPFSHAFTHFRLEAEPWLVCELPPSKNTAPTSWGPPRPRISLSLSDLDGAALPSPVKKLLRRLGPAA